MGGAPSPLPQLHTQAHLQSHTHHSHTHSHIPVHSHNRSAIDLLHQQQQFLMHQHAVAAAAAAGFTRAAVGAMPDEYLQPLKRLRMSGDGLGMEPLGRPELRTPSPVHSAMMATTPHAVTATTTNASSGTKGNVEGVKSFSIADILGHDKRDSCSVSPPHAHSSPRGLIQPRTEPLDIVTGTVPHPAAAAAMLLPTATPHVVRPWDHLLGPLPVRPFIPSALLHYEQRLALDYHRQLQEHFNAQAQLLRHMNGIDVIPSESGSERSSSAASDCCSPEIVRSNSETHSKQLHLSERGAIERSGGHHHSGNGNNSNNNNTHSNNGNGSSGGNVGGVSLGGAHHQHPSSASSSASSGGGTGASGGGSMSGCQKTKPNGTPLDALFQMTTKDFDESQGKSDQQDD